MRIFTLISISIMAALPLSSSNAEDHDSFCLSGGLLKDYGCQALSHQLAENSVYSIQLLLEGVGLPELTDELAVYHRTPLAGDRAFIYVGSFEDKKSALDTMSQLVDGQRLDVSLWRPALVEISKGSKVPSIRLVQMYQSMSFSHLAPKESIGSQNIVEENASRAVASSSDKRVESYFTVQLASFKTITGRDDFITEQGSQDKFICRTRRNGRFTIYSGAFNKEVGARRVLMSLRDKYPRAYVLRLQDEDMMACDQASKIVLYSKTLPPQRYLPSIPQNSSKPRLISNSAVVLPIERVRAKHFSQYFTIQLASYMERSTRDRFVARDDTLPLLCRTSRKGYFVVYSDVFQTEGEAEVALRLLQKKTPKAYVLALHDEDMYSCLDESKLLVYSKTTPPKSLSMSAVKRPSKPSVSGANKRNGSKYFTLNRDQFGLDDRSISSALGAADKTKVATRSTTRQKIAQLNVVAPEKMPESRVGSITEEVLPEDAEASVYALAAAGDSLRGLRWPKAEGLAPIVSAPSSPDKPDVVIQTRQFRSKDRLPDDWQPELQQIFYTVQLATFKGPRDEGAFVDKHRELQPLCRIRRNGQYAVYSGKYLDYQTAKQSLAYLPQSFGAYVVRLRGVLLPSCQG